MTGFPPGEWSPLLVGDHWPCDQDLMALSNAKTNRGKVKTGYSNYAGTLNNAQTGPLAGQQGHTADDLRNAFRQGEDHAHQLAEKSGVKESAYGSAYDSMVSLQHDLTSLAEEGNKHIKEIQDSKVPVEAKVTQIVAAINQSRALANIAAAKYGGNVIDAMQRILDAEGTGQSARQFTQAHGVDVGQMFRRSDVGDDLQKQVEGVLTKGGSSAGIPANVRSAPAAFAPSHVKGGPPAGLPKNLSGQHSLSGTKAPEAKPTFNRLPSNLHARSGLVSAPGTSHGVSHSGTPGASVDSAMSLPRMASGHHPSISGATGSLTGLSSALTNSRAQGLNPGALMHSFDKGFDNGLQAGEPFSNAAGAPPQSPMASVDPTAATSPSAGLGSPATAPVYDSSAPVAHTPTPDATPAPQVVTGSAIAPSPAAVAPTSSGSLPAYASDLRPTVSAATTPAGPSSPSPSAMPASAPANLSAGQGGVAGPTVMRPSTPSVPASSPASLGAQTVAATATGAVVGAASAEAAARTRLQRLVSAVARQQPRLAWAVGDRADDTTVLATDLAGGWIPPGIELPATVTLLAPGRRSGRLENLLGEVTVTAGYTPIHHVPDEDEPVPTSPRPRQVPENDELGWELNQATQWRDGLPRLAHTLAKAASTGSGVLDTEVGQLHEYLAAVSARVLDSYPDHVDPHDVGNWQLLAAIDALVADDKSAANYHLAWFQASSTSTAR